MKTLKSILAVALVAILFVGIMTAQTRTGKDVFVDSKCTTCHSVTSQDIASKGKAPDLSDKGGKMSDGDLKLYLNKEFDYNSKKHPVKYKGTPEDLDLLITFIQGLTVKSE
jgi:cytochrome c2